MLKEYYFSYLQKKCMNLNYIHTMTKSNIAKQIKFITYITERLKPMLKQMYKQETIVLVLLMKWMSLSALFKLNWFLGEMDVM